MCSARPLDMSLYHTIGKLGPRVVDKPTLFKWGFNLSPMYRRSTARIVDVSDDLHRVSLRLPISYKNKNYVGAIFGGSLFSAVDPIPMVQLINILDNRYIVWDRSAEVVFRAPARQDVVAESAFTADEIRQTVEAVEANGETDITRTLRLTDASGETTFCVVTKTLYVATKAHHRAKRERRAEARRQATASAG